METFLFWQMVEAACGPVTNSNTCKEIEKSMVEKWCLMTGIIRVDCCGGSKCHSCKIHTANYWFRDATGTMHKVCAVCSTPV